MGNCIWVISKFYYREVKNNVGQTQLVVFDLHYCCILYLIVKHTTGMPQLKILQPRHWRAGTEENYENALGIRFSNRDSKYTPSKYKSE